jgi:hypothetical protein
MGLTALEAGVTYPAWDSLKNDLTLTLPLLCKHYRYLAGEEGHNVRHSTPYNLLTLVETMFPLTSIGITEDRVRIMEQAKLEVFWDYV